MPEVDYIQRIMRSLTDSSTSPAQSTDQDSGMGSSSYSFNPWGFYPPPPERQGPVAEPSEPSGRADLSPIQREILADFPWLASKEESDACTPVPAQTPTDPVAWAQSMLELENSSTPQELQSSPVRFLDQAWSGSGTPAAPETPFHSESLSSSLSDGEAELKQTQACSESGTETAGTSGAQSGKRKRAAEQEDGENAPSDDQETSKKKPM